MKILIFPFSSDFNIRYLCEFWRYDNDPIIKKHLFSLKFSNLKFFFLPAHTPARAARHDKCSKHFIFDHFFEYRRLRAHLARAQVRARKFGARHRIEHHQSNILCIYNNFISLKVAEIECFEVFSDRRPSLKIREKKVPPLKYP